MARTKREVGSSNASGTAESVELLVETVISECVRWADLSQVERQTELKAQWPFFAMIPVGSGSIETSRAGIAAVDRLAARYRLERPEVHAGTSEKAYAQQVLLAVGDTIENLGSLEVQEDENWVPAATALFTRRLEERLSHIRRDLTRYVPCHIFDPHQDAPTFTVGPVTFSPRLEWLAHLAPARMRADLVRDVWEGRLSFDDLRRIAHEDRGGNDAWPAYRAVSAIGAYPWIAIVPVQGHEPSQSARKAATLVALALDFLSLLLDPVSGSRIVHAGGERTPISEHRLASGAEGNLIEGWSFNKCGTGGQPGYASEFLHRTAPVRDAAGAILTYYADESADFTDLAAAVEDFVKEVREQPKRLKKLELYG